MAEPPPFFFHTTRKFMVEAVNRLHQVIVLVSRRVPVW